MDVLIELLRLDAHDGERALDHLEAIVRTIRQSIAGNRFTRFRFVAESLGVLLATPGAPAPAPGLCALVEREVGPAEYARRVDIGRRGSYDDAANRLYWALPWD
jgi:hypothetical protein